MPQLDKLTFISQLFWLFSTFLVFYVLSLKYFLPTISHMLKIRNKRLKIYQDQMKQLRLEEFYTISNYEKLLINSLNESRNFLNKASSTMVEWFNSSVKNTNDTHLLNVNKSYVEAMNNITIQKYLVKKGLPNTK